MLGYWQLLDNIQHDTTFKRNQHVRPTVLAIVGQQSWERLHGPKKLVYLLLTLQFSNRLMLKRRYLQTVTVKLHENLLVWLLFNKKGISTKLLNLLGFHS